MTELNAQAENAALRAAEDEIIVLRDKLTAAIEDAAKIADEYILSAPDNDIELAESSTASLIAQDIRALKATVGKT